MSKKRGILIGALVSIGVLLFYWSAPTAFEVFELQLLDNWLKVRPAAQSLDKMTVILVDERALGRYRLGDEFRFALADLIDGLNEAGVRVIGLDILFPWDDEESPLPPSLQRLSEAIAGSRCVVLGYQWDLPELNEPFDDLERAERLRVIFGNRSWRMGCRGDCGEKLFYRPERARVSASPVVRSGCSQGYVSVISGIDQVVRSIPMAISMQGQFLTPFSVSVARRYLGISKWDVSESDGVITDVRLGDSEIPTDMAGRMLILPPGPPSVIATYDFISAIEGAIPTHRLKDGIVLIGVSGIEGHDLLLTSYGPNTPGVYLHAEAVINLLEGNFLRRDLLTRMIEITWLLLLPIILGFILTRIRPLLALIVPPMMAVAVIYGTKFALTSWNHWFVTSYLLIAIFSAQIAVLAMRLAHAERSLAEIKAKDPALAEECEVDEE